ncbi:MAG: YhfX family PLP-dependent enzyme [Chloroflexi bacterium]|jgi:predicted amino acid racemase|nr:YhfX family PLP-dependent enzyme [Chloroflexota bacterium]
MFLQRLIDRNPRLLEAAIELQQSGRIPPNTWVIDLDAVAENARLLAAEAKRLGLRTYVMSKQYARNPYVSVVALANGLNKMVAVDVQCSLLLRRYGIPVGHMGHLNQIPRHLVADMVAMRPEVITVYNAEHARWIDAAATAQGVRQDVLMRVIAPGDIFFDGQEGGVPEEDVAAVAHAIGRLSHVRLVGVTSFPCVRYNPLPSDPRAEATPNFHTILRAAAILRGVGIAVTQINAPGNTSSFTMAMLAEHGATHVEPGHGLLGTTPHQIYVDGLPERPTYAWVTEISHHVGDRAYAFGGGLFSDMKRPGFQDQALVGSSWSEALHNPVDHVQDIDQLIDYHAILHPGNRCRVGDSAVFGFRPQMQMTRSYIAPVSGLSSTRTIKEVRVHYLFDHATTALDDRYNPVDLTVVRRDIDALLSAG